VSEESLRRVHAPIGVAVGAVTPEEIAVSILAEMTAVRRGGLPGRDGSARYAAARTTPAREDR
jgi:xanthine dehydrogenase accessory factor